MPLISGEARHAFVHVIEGSQIEELNHGEETPARRDPRWQPRWRGSAEGFLDEQRHFQRMEGGACDANGDIAESAGGRPIGQEVVGEERVKIEDRAAVDAGPVGSAHHDRCGAERVRHLEDSVRQ